jgi:hypothetical protein
MKDNDLLFIRKQRAEIAHFIHYEMTSENWKENKILIQILENIDYHLKLKDAEFDEVE